MSRNSHPLFVVKAMGVESMDAAIEPKFVTVIRFGVFQEPIEKFVSTFLRPDLLIGHKIVDIQEGAMAETLQESKSCDSANFILSAVCD